jgi:deazaflavin-dependent oxidoreductase (nitroreductase family)
LASTYRLTHGRRAVNRVVRTLNAMGIGSDCDCLLTVTGRKSGISRTTPVTLVQEGTCRWIVAPYGEVAWVQNARAAGQVTLSHGRRSETVSFTELGPVESAPVLPGLHQESGRHQAVLRREAGLAARSVRG